MRKLWGRLLCWLGWHDLEEVVEEAHHPGHICDLTFRCKRCGEWWGFL